MKSPSLAVRLLLSVLFMFAATPSSAFAATQTGTLTAAQTQYYDITLSTPQDGLRLVLSTTTTSNFSLYTGTVHGSGTLVTGGNSLGKTLHTLLIPKTSLTDGGSYHVRITALAVGLDYSFTDDLTYARDLTWDDGLLPGGTSIMVQPDTAGGDYLFRINTPTSAYGAWRTILKTITGGEAAFYMRLAPTPPTTTSSTHKSERVGEDGLILAAGQFAAGQDWYILVHASVGTSWQLLTGDIYTQDLGPVTDASANPAVTIGPEGSYYFKTTIDNSTQGWRLWANDGSGTVNLPLIVRKGSAPVSGYNQSIQQSETGQMLLVPPYLTASDSYLVGITGTPGTTFNFDSRKQQFTDLAFEGSTSLTVPGYGYITYRVEVPIDQIAWQVNLGRQAAAGNPELYIRQGNIPNRWNNDALSEAPAGVGDSVTLVPPALTNGTWYITVYGTGTYDYTLTSKKPEVTDIPYITSVTNADSSRSGWRYYKAGDIGLQLGSLGWQIQLDLAHRTGRELAIRQNAVPAKWNYRSNDNPTLLSASHLDKQSAIGILQDPNHVADIWYVGVYAPNVNLDAFELTTLEIPAPQVVLAESSTSVTSQPVELWQWHKFSVPVDAALKGWDLRLKATAGTPQMVVRRDSLPNTFSTTSGTCGPSAVYLCTSWPSDHQWTTTPGQDWTSRSYITYNTVKDRDSYLVMGMGSPLEAGTYYVGVSRATGSADTTPLSYTLESRGIGSGGGYPVQVQDLAYAGGTVSASDLAPREVGWYRVTVPPGATSWALNLTPTLGEALLAVRHGRLPNITAAGNDTDNSVYFNGTTRQKAGNEYFYKYAPNGQTLITSGDYYVAVISEGQNPANANAIGTGTVNYTLTSVGEMPIDSKTGTPVAAGVITGWTGQSAPYNTQMVYRFRVPAGLTSIEVRLKNKTGNPVFSIRQDATDAGRIPYPQISGVYTQEGGNSYAWRNNASTPVNTVTIASPVAGDYTLTLAAISEVVNSVTTYPDAAYDLEVEGMDTVNLPFASGSVGAAGQDPQTWNYYKVTVPADAALKGWDLRLKTTAGSPQMVVRRDLLPNTFATSSGACGNSLTICSSWSSGNQWTTTPGQDWTGRSYITFNTVKDKDSYLIMGMGSPLEAGTYYVGVSRATGSADSTPLSYTLESRGIGSGGGYPVQVQDLAYAGGTANTSGLAPREVGWYRVSVPAGATSWSLNLTPTLGEALLAVRHGRLPNITAYSNDSDHPSYFNGTTRQKAGDEYFYKYAPNGQTLITAGDYYVAVISEGQNTANINAIGTDTINFTLTSVGEVPIADQTGTPVADGVITSWTGQNVPYGSQKVYRFRVPAGLTSIEVRLKNKTGNPVFSIRQDVTDAGRIPYPQVTGTYTQEGGNAYAWRNNIGTPVNIVTIASPAAGDYTLTLAASPVVNNTTVFPDAGYDLEVEGMGTVNLPFANGSAGATEQDYQTWRYFLVTVPADAALKGWDLRLKTTAGTPQMVVRRDSLPSSFNTTSGSCGYSVSICSNWSSGSQWTNAPGQDWTGRSYITYSTVKDKDGYLIMGMGSPLEAGTYYIGVSRATGSTDTTPLSYTLESRGIGSGGGYPVQVQDLAYAGGTVSSTDLAPREVGWYRVTVPAGATSWALNLAPNLGEAMLAARHGRLPNITAAGNDTDNASYFNGTTRQKSGNEYFYKYAPNGQTLITSGDYYVAVISEGQNPANANAIGTGTVNYTLTSVGEMPIDSKTGTPIAAGVITSWTGQSAPYNSQKVYRFRVPAGLTSIEVRLKNKTGNPVFSIRQDANDAGRIPYPQISGAYTQEGGNVYAWRNNISTPVNTVTIASPVAGDYTLTLAAISVVVNNVTTYPDAGYDLEIGVVPALPLELNGGNASGSLIDQQVAYYQVTVPDTVNGFPITGWKLVTSATLGSATLRVAKGEVPGATTPSLASSQQNTVIAPPYLSPGTWYIEVKGNGLTDYTITSDIISADPARHSRSWTMPGKNGTFTQAGLTAPYFGDSGVDEQGGALPTTGQGTDLAENDWHFYRITVPVGNGGLLRTVVEAISGTPEIYIREANGVPSPFHKAHTTNPNDVPSPWAYNRLQTLTTGTLYGNWVPLDGKTETELASGEWWIGIKAVTTNVRYRLKVAAGNVRDVNGPVDAAGYVQDMNQDGGSYAGQTLAPGDMRYYRVQVPQSSTTVANSTPLAWNLTLTQQIGDVVVFVRDTIPPGQGANGNAGATLTNSSATSTYFQNWYDDNSTISPNPYIVIDTPNIPTTLALPPVEPGKTYYLGVYARDSATFDLSSAVGGSNLSLTAVLPFTNGTDTRTLAAGEQALYRIDVPADGILWHHNATNVAGIQLYLEQGSVPTENSNYNHWRSNGAVNSVLNQNLTAFPWQPGHSYYLLAKNTTAGALPFSIILNGHTSLVGLDITVAGNGSGNITSSPNLISCASGTCSAQLFPYTAITLSHTQTTGTTFTGWSGDCAGTGTCALTMSTAHAVTATFTLNSYTVTASRAGTGTGSVASTPAGIDCRTGGICSAGFLYGSSVTLTATPDPGNAFTGWSGACVGTGPCTFTVNAAKSATATFVPLRSLSIVFGGSGSGTVTSTSHAGISCMTGSAAGCTYDYPNSTVVSLSAVADWKSVFSSWSGTTSSSGATGSVTMNAAKNVTVTFGSAANTRIGLLDYPTFLDAYTAAPSGATVLMKNIVFVEDVVISPASPATIYTLKGGYVDFAGSATGYSTIKGSLKIRNGKLIVERLIIKQ